MTNMGKIEEAASGRAGKYLTFVLGNESYGIEILKVREIFGILHITPVPQTPPCMKGVINLRGKVTPVVDLRLKFNMEEKEHTQETCIIVVNVNESLIGIIVDTVNEVIDISEDQIEDPPKFSAGKMKSDTIKGMGKIGDKVRILLNIERVLDEKELTTV